MSNTELVYTTYIKTTPEKLWAAITNPEFARQYWGGHVNISDWKKGSTWRHENTNDNNAVRVKGKVLESTPPKILDGVPETLAYLTERHRLILFTKGEPAEQSAKVQRSGLQGFFEAIEIVPEKDTVTYSGLVNKHKIVKTQGWMIGNSPRSDINPAMKVGLNAVYIPHQHTWHMEHEPVMAGSGKLVILPAFRELRSHF